MIECIGPSFVRRLKGRWALLSVLFAAIASAPSGCAPAESTPAPWSQLSRENCGLRNEGWKIYSLFQQEPDYFFCENPGSFWPGHSVKMQCRVEFGDEVAVLGFSVKSGLYRLAGVAKGRIDKQFYLTDAETIFMCDDQ